MLHTLLLTIKRSEKMAELVFKRYELKYVLTREKYLAIKNEAEKQLCPDRFGINTIQSLYYDTADNRLIRASVENRFSKKNCAFVVTT